MKIPRSLALLFVLTLFALMGSHQLYAQEKPQPIHLGAIAVLSGEGAAWGVNFQRGIVLASEAQNSKGGIKGRDIKLSIEDSPHGLAKSAVTAYRKLTNHKEIKFILGPVMMDELLAIAPLAQREGRFIAGATYMPSPPRNFFTTWIDADTETDRMATFVRSRHQRVAILSSKQSWESQVAHRFAETFVKSGGTMVSMEEPLSDATSVKTEVVRMKQGDPQAIFISSYLLLPKYVRELKTLGVTAPLFGIELDQSVIENSGVGAEGLVFIAPSAPALGFTEKFIKRWGVNPEIPAASSYDAASALFKALEERGEDVSAVADYFATLKEFDGVTGKISKLDGKTSVETSYYTVKGGKIVRF